MSNQRLAKLQRKATFNDSGSMLRQVINFAKEAEELLEKQGEEDAAFYFEQVETHMRNGGTLDQNKAGNILGV